MSNSCEMDLVFICADSGPAREFLIGELEEWGIPSVMIVVRDDKSLHLLQHLPCFAQHLPNPPPLLDGIPGESPVLARVPVGPWRAGSQCAAVHAAALLAAHRR
jgi:hypothetical protein